jgi:hypothetical protein
MQIAGKFPGRIRPGLNTHENESPAGDFLHHRAGFFALTH